MIYFNQLKNENRSPAIFWGLFAEKKKHIILSAFVLLLLCCFASTGKAQKKIIPYSGAPGWQETKDSRMAWFREARFGMFIHWGLYSAAGGQWKGVNNLAHYAEQIQSNEKISSKEYSETLRPKFTAAKFNAAEWSRIASEAGMRYVVITSKHHEGFTLFNSKQPFAMHNNITGSINLSPKGRDLYGELVAAFKKQGLKVGAYYSLWDWQHPDSYNAPGFNKENNHPDHELYKEYLYQQLKELANNYDGLDIFWPDFSSSEVQGEAWGTKRLLTDLIKWKPQIIMNNRLWKGQENKYGDFSTPEKYVPPTGMPGVDWEVSHTMNESYGYSAHDTHWKSYDKTMRLFLETVSKGGNFLLNVGPDGEGAFPAQAVQLLKEIGQWMKVNSESVYGTKASPFQTLDWGYCTQKPGKLYLHLFDVPKDGLLELPLLSTVKQAYVLGQPKKKIRVEKNTLGTRIYLLDDDKRQMRPIVIALAIAGPVEIVKSNVVPQDDGKILLTANNAKLRGAKGIKLIGATTQSPNRPNAIGSWTDPADDVYWDVKITKPGLYKLTVNYFASNGASGTISVGEADHQLRHEFNNDKGDEIKTIEIGRMVVGEQMTDNENLTIRLKAEKITGKKLPEIISITLIPINGN